MTDAKEPMSFAVRAYLDGGLHIEDLSPEEHEELERINSAIAKRMRTDLGGQREATDDTGR